MPRYRVVKVDGKLVSGTGIKIKGKYALYDGREFIAAADTVAELEEKMRTENDWTAVLVIALVLLLMIFSGEIIELVTPYV